MRLRNNIFAEALRWLKKNVDGIKYQKDVAARVGVSEDTITRIMRDQTEVTDDFLCKFNEAFDNIFNYQWLRGEDPYHMLMADVMEARMEEKSANQTQQAPVASIPPAFDLSILIEQAVKAATAHADAHIASLEKQVKDKDDQLADKKRIIELLEQKIEALEAMQHIDASDMLRNHPFPIGVADKDELPRAHV